MSYTPHCPTHHIVLHTTLSYTPHCPTHHNVHPAIVRKELKQPPQCPTDHSVLHTLSYTPHCPTHHIVLHITLSYRPQCPPSYSQKGTKTTTTLSYRPHCPPGRVAATDDVTQHTDKHHITHTPAWIYDRKTIGVENRSFAFLHDSRRDVKAATTLSWTIQ